MVPCHATSCVSPFDHLPYGRARRSGSRPRLRAPFAPPPAHQYRPGSDDRWRCSVKRTAIILAPDAVLVDGPGYIAPDGRSVMPSYPDLTLRQLADLVAYLKSLTAGGAAEMLTAAPPAPVKDLPAPPAEPTTYYYVQAYDVLPGRLDEFEAWFRDEGARAFLAHDGLVRVDTWVDTTRDGPSLVTVLGLRDEDALERFLDDPAPDLLGQKFDDFIGPLVFRRPPVYHAPAAA